MVSNKFGHFKIVLVVFCLACTSQYSTKQLDKYWNALVQSKNAIEEESSLDDLRNFIRREDISLEVFRNINGKLIDFRDAEIKDSVYPISVRFQKIGDSTQITKGNWIPKTGNAPYSFFRE